MQTQDLSTMPEGIVGVEFFQKDVIVARQRLDGHGPVHHHKKGAKLAIVFGGKLQFIYVSRARGLQAERGLSLPLVKAAA